MSEKKFFEKFKNPPKWVYVLTFAFTFCFVGLDFVCLFLWRDFVFVYFIYALSAILLSYAIYLFVLLCPKIKQGTTNLLNKNKLTKRVLDDKDFRKSVFAVCGDIINIAYLVLLSISAVTSRSVWIALLAGYYFLLILTKTVLLVGGAKIIGNKVEDKDQKARKVYRNTGIFFVIMAFAISGMIVQMITMEAGISYKDLFVYAVAAYTFYKVILTIVNIIKNRRNPNFVTRAIINISTVTSIVSLYSLQIGMIKTFGDSGMEVINMISGICVGLAILGMGVFMIVKGQKEIQKLKENQGLANGKVEQNF